MARNRNRQQCQRNSEKAYSVLTVCTWVNALKNRKEKKYSLLSEQRRGNANGKRWAGLVCIEPFGILLKPSLALPEWKPKRNSLNYKQKKKEREKEASCKVCKENMEKIASLSKSLCFKEHTVPSFIPTTLIPKFPGCVWSQRCQQGAKTQSRLPRDLFWTDER